jgi:predicted dehydrogenase
MDVATQMGNQGTSSGGLRRSVEIVRSGAIGDVREVHVWTNRPGSYWKQAMHRPAEPDSIPPSLNWDLWLGASPERPYNRGLYAHFAWRGWWDFGTGALGDMACHTANLPFMALKLGYPTSIEAETSQRFPESGPAWSIIKFEYPAREGFPPCTLTWYDGGQLPPAELFEGIEPRGSGSLMVGSEGKLYSPDDYGQRSQLLPETDFEGFEAPEPTLPRTEGHYEEWIAACKGGAPAMSNFEYSGLLTESILLGNLAIRGGHRIEWDAENARASNCDFVDEFIKPESRAGHSLEA